MNHRNKTGFRNKNEGAKLGEIMSLELFSPLDERTSLEPKIEQNHIVGAFREYVKNKMHIKSKKHLTKQKQ